MTFCRPVSVSVDGVHDAFLTLPNAHHAHGLVTLTILNSSSCREFHIHTNIVILVRSGLSLVSTRDKRRREVLS